MAKKKKKKKKQKLNIRLLLIIALVLGGVGVVGGGVLYYQGSWRATRNITSGLKAMDEGDYRLAKKYFGRVLYRQPDNVIVYENLLTTYDNIVPVSQVEARELFNERRAVMLSRAKNLPAAEENYIPLIEELYYSARITDREEYPQQLMQVCDEIERRFPESSEIYAEAKLYRGLCTLRLRDGEMTDDLRIDGRIYFPGEEEIMEHVELVPGSDEGWAHLAFGRLAVARRLGLEGRVGQEAKNLRHANTTYKEAVANNPDGAATTLMVLRDYYIQKVVQTGEIQNDSARISQAEIDELEERLQAALDHAERIVKTDPGSMPIKVQELLMYFKRVDFEHGQERAAALLEAYLADQPEDIRFRLALADVFHVMKDYVSALKEVQQVIGADQKTISLESLEQYEYRLAAASLDFEIAHSLWVDADQDDKEMSFDIMIDKRETLDDMMSGDKDNIVALNADARIAMGQGEYKKAANFFERLIFIANAPSGVIYRNAAICLERIGQQGLALERLDAAVQVQPMQLSHYLAKASMEGRLKRAEEGIRTLESLPPGIQQDDEAVKELMASLQLLLRTSNQTGLEGIGDPVLQVIGEANNEVRVGNLDLALEKLQSMAAEMDTVDVRLLLSIAQVESLRGNIETALELMDAAIAADPDNERLERIRLQLSAADILEVAQESVRQSYSDSESLEAKEAMFIALHVVIAQQSQRAEELARLGQLEESAKTRGVASRAQVELDQLEPSVMGSGPSGNLNLFSIQFERAIEARDWPKLEELVEYGSESNIDLAGGDIFRSRFHIAQAYAEKEAGNDGLHAEHAEAAVLAATRATEVSSWSDNAWLARAISLEELGNVEDAIDAYAEAYRRNPSRSQTARLYAGILVRSGNDPLVTLRVLKDAHELLPNDDLIREGWLKAESNSGSVSRVLSERGAIHRSHPNNIQNNLELANLLSTLELKPEYMIDEYGKEVFTEREWGSMSKKFQDKAIGDYRKQWENTRSAILEKAGKSPDVSLAHAILHAQIYDNLQMRNEAVLVLQRFLKANESDPNYVPMVISVANMLLQIDRAREAGELLLKAVPRQEARTRPVDIALGQLFVMAGDYRRALPHILAGYEATKSPKLHASLIRAMVKLRRFEQAQSELEKFIGAQPPTYDSMMLRAMMASEKFSVASSKGDQAGAVAATEDYRRWLAEASQTDKMQPRPYVELIDSMLLEYSTTRNQEILEQAAFIAESGIRLLPESDTLAVKRSEILQAQGRINLAVQELESILRKHAGSDELRNRLTLAYLQAGQNDKAEDLIREAISLYPDNGKWYEALGDFYQSLPTPSLVKSTEAYLNAYSKEPRRSIMLKLRNVTRTSDRWDYDTLISLINNAGVQSSRDPKLMGLYARALAGKGSYDRADGQIRRSYPIYTSEIEIGNLSRTGIRDWYEDLYAVYANRDPAEGEVLAVLATSGKDSLWDSVGLATYWGLFGEPGLGKAIEIQKRAVEQSLSDEPDVYLGMLMILGSYQVAHGEPQDAAAVFKSIIDQNPQDSGALNNYAYILATELGQPEQALEYATQAASISPDSTAILDTIATIYALTGEHEKAMVSRLRQHSLEPENAEVLISISNAYCDDLGDMEKGLDYAKRANQIMSSDPHVLDTLGWVYYRTGNQAEGEEYIRSSIKSSPTSNAHLHMAHIFIDQGRRDKAKDHLQKALDLSPDDGTRSEIERLQDDIGRD